MYQLDTTHKEDYPNVAFLYTENSYIRVKVFSDKKQLYFVKFISKDSENERC